MSIHSAVLACMGIAILGSWAFAAKAADDVGVTQEPKPDEERRPLSGAVVASQPIPAEEIPFEELTNFVKQRPGEVLELDLPFIDDKRAGPGAVLRVRLDTVSPTGDGRHMLSGHSVARRADLVVLVVSDDSLGGRVTVDDQHYLIRKIGPDHYLLALDPGLLPPPAPPALPKPSTVPGRQHNPPPHPHPDVTCDPEVRKVVSVLVLYTQAARKGAAQAAADQAKIDWTLVDGDEVLRTDAVSALGAANLALQNSEAATSFGTTINAEPVQYFETGDGHRALEHLYTPGHPLYVAARDLRQRSGQEANLVTLVIEHWLEACGIAPLMIDWDTHPDQTAFSVVRRDCLEGEHFSLAHELAHSMGSAHDPASADVPGLFAFSYGYNAKDEGLSTIMAYPCADCVRQPQYSNPDVNFLASGSASYAASGENCMSATSDPGCRPANNVDSIDRAACQVVHWR
jgi:hypothetical protein